MTHSSQVQLYQLKAKYKGHCGPLLWQGELTDFSDSTDSRTHCHHLTSQSAASGPYLGQARASLDGVPV